MIIAAFAFLWILFISMIYLDFSPIILGLSTRGLDFLLEPKVVFVGLFVGEILFLLGLYLRRRRHGYNIPLYISALAALAILLGAWFSPPLLGVGVLFQGIALYLDMKTPAQGLAGSQQTR